MELNENLISLRDVATRFGKRTTTISRIIERLGIKSVLQPRSGRHNRTVKYINQIEIPRIAEELAINSKDPSEAFEPDSLPTEQGVFYFIQLEPDHDPNRFKVGFTTNMQERLRALKCSAPFATVVKSWKSRRLWEKTAIDCVTNGCQQLHTEVFRAESIQSIIANCERFFQIMPSLETSIPTSLE